jgi:basic amino acid/polyamine antiporter, APA family
VGSIGAEAFARAASTTRAPLEAAAGPAWVRAALAIGAATALGSVFLNLHLGLSRMTFAMARGGDLPGALANVNAASSPFMAVLLVGLALAAVIVVQDVKKLVSVSAFSVLVYYGLTNLSALRLSREERLVHPAVPWTGLAFCLTLAASVPPRELAAGAGILAAGVLWRWIWRSRKAAAAVKEP